VERRLFEPEHDAFRTSFRAFVEREIVPHYPAWDKARLVDRSVWSRAGAQGFLCLDVPEEFGGSGVTDFRYNVVITEELTRVGAPGVGFPLHTDIVVPYLSRLATVEQKRRWLPGAVAGECITAIAMSEPAAGSDLQGITTTAIRQGDHYLLNGQKTFISNGILNDLVIVVARTDPSQGHRGISLLVVERGMEGYQRGRNLEKIGQHAQDTAELFFRDVLVPVGNLLGEEGRGFGYLMDNLPVERLAIAVGSTAAAEVALAQTVAYCREREAFGKKLGALQHVRFELAEMHTEVTVTRVFVDRCIGDLNQGSLSTETASMAKWWATEVAQRVTDRCLQLFGGYGYMTEYPISRAWVDNRVAKIYGGSNEIMKEIIGRRLVSGD
jgi:alkylation response protein AidB-like acyl-CoA dehydrogenase